MNTNKENYVNLSKIYTKRGDSGETSLLNGKSVKKSNIQVEAYGTLDEANSILGFSKSLIEDKYIKDIITRIQEKFIIISAYLSAGEEYNNYVKEKIVQEDIKFLENNINKFNEKLLPLNKFIIPGENRSSSSLHIARTVVRRAERKIVEFNEMMKFPIEILKFINRTSDLLFVLARVEEDNNTVNYIKNKLVEILENKKSMDIKNLKKISLSMAKRIVSAGEKKAMKMSKNFVFTILNEEGNLILQERMDDALLASIDVSYKKAYTAVSLKMSTEGMGELVKPGEPLYTLQNNSKYVMFAGGIPLFVNENLFGAIGVSGGTVEEDLIIVKECEKEFKNILEENNGYRKK